MIEGMLKSWYRTGNYDVIRDFISSILAVISVLVILVGNAGHNSNTDQPDEVNRLIEKFIGEVDGKNLAKSKKTILYEA
jgi:pimeloyl-ACP methyl ester carboxylesterase